MNKITMVAAHKKATLALLKKGYGIVGWGCSDSRARKLGIRTSKQVNKNECTAFEDYEDCYQCAAFFWILEHGCGSKDLKENHLL